MGHFARFGTIVASTMIPFSKAETEVLAKLKSATLLKVTHLHGCFLRFLKCKAYQIA